MSSIDQFQNTIDLYDLADDKLTDHNKDEICNKLQGSVKNLEASKFKFDLYLNKIFDKIDDLYDNKDDAGYRVAYNKINNIHKGLIKAQKLSTSLVKICT